MGALAAKGELTGGGTRCPVLHCLTSFDHPSLQSYLKLFNDGATKHKAALLEMAQFDRDVKQRSTALFLLAHAADEDSLLPLLAKSIYDANALVRNNGMRVMIGMALRGLDA